MEVDVADCFKVRQKETGWTSAYVLGQLETLDLFSHSIVLASGIRLSKQSFLDFLGFLGYCGPLNSQYRNTWHGHHNVRGQLDVHVGQAFVQLWTSGCPSLAMKLKKRKKKLRKKI